MTEKEEKIKELALQVSEFWYGAHLFLRFVSETETPSMDWYYVNFPVSNLDEPDYKNLSTLFHEWGHRTISPESYEKVKVWELLVYKMIKNEIYDIDSKVYHEIINIVTDLWVDNFYMNNPETADFYIKSTKENLRKARENIYKTLKELSGDARECFKRNSGLFLLFLDLYEVIIAKAEKRNPLYRSVLVENAYNVIFDNSLSYEKRIKEFVNLVSDIIRNFCGCSDGHDASKGFVNCKSFRVNGLSDSHSEKDADVNKIIKILKKHGIRPGGSDLKSVFGIKKGKAIYKKIREFELYNKLIDIVETYYRKVTTKKQYAGFTRWKVGEKITELEVVRGIERYGKIIPNINTIKKNYMNIKKDKGFGKANLCLIIDDSGSMISDVDRLQEALYSIILMAEKRRDSVSVIVFGSDISYEMKPSKNYEGVKDVIFSLEAGSGGSVIDEAIKKAIEFSMSVEKQTTFIFTDTYLYEDSQELKSLFSKLSKTSKIVIFAYTENKEDSVAFSKIFSMKNVKIYYVKPGESYFEKSLEEIK